MVRLHIQHFHIFSVLEIQVQLYIHTLVIQDFLFDLYLCVTNHFGELIPHFSVWISSSSMCCTTTLVRQPTTAKMDSKAEGIQTLEDFGQALLYFSEVLRDLLFHHLLQGRFCWSEENKHVRIHRKGKSILKEYHGEQSWYHSAKIHYNFIIRCTVGKQHLSFLC